MFNLPFPTDSLYKFSFMFGLVLILFSFYFKDKQLNKFNTNQTYHVIDSLDEAEDLSKIAFDGDSGLFSTIQNAFFAGNSMSDSLGVDLIKSGLNAWQNLVNDERPYLMKQYPHISREYNKIMKDTLRELDSYKQDFFNFKSSVLNIDSSSINNVKGKKLFFSSKLKEDKTSYWGLVACGSLLFILGTIGWYFKIQKPQDELLLMQIAQAKQSVNGTKDNPKVIVIGRKHIDPINTNKKGAK